MEPPRIQPLPASLVAQIRSSVSITSIADVVKGLLENSLDANASNIQIKVDLKKGYVYVLDTGDGIFPNDIELLGQRHATSKSTPPASFGYRGEFLASLAGLSILDISSRRKDWFPTYAVRFHFGSRLLCGQVQSDSYLLRHCGTQVIVRNVFANYPVRVQGRENMSKGDAKKEWGEIRRKVVETVLLSNGDVGVSVTTDEEWKIKWKFNLSSTETWEERGVKILEQSGYGRTSWEPVEGQWNDIRVSGMIGSVPVIDTQTQFIYLNGVPVPKTVSSVPYSKVNSLFSISSFGTLDNVVPPKKGAEKHPAFVLRVTTDSHTLHAEDFEREDGSSQLTAVIQLLESLVDQFLREFGFILKRRLKTQDTEGGNPHGAKRGKVPLKTATGDSLVPSWGEIRRADLAFDHDFPLHGKSSSNILPQSFPTRDQAPVNYLQPAVQTGLSQTQAIGDLASDVASWPARAGIEIGACPPSKVLPKRLTLPAVSSIRPRIIPSYLQSFGKINGRASESTPGKTPLQDYLESVFRDPPVFLMPEAPIRQPFTWRPRSEFLGDSSDGPRTILTKESLATARVLPNQYSLKYIVLMSESPASLVLMDQHAADERVRLEKLWQDYDSEPKPLKKPMSFTLDWYEANVMLEYMPQMRDWGFDFKVVDTGHVATVEVLGVQELVRDRLASDPTIIVDLVRTWLGELLDGIAFKPFVPGDGWVRRMTSATRKLEEIFASKSCRGAIMFNDELSPAQCEDLVRSLAGCAFPFQCAHGRPTVAPVLDLTGGGVEEEFGGDCSYRC